MRTEGKVRNGDEGNYECHFGVAFVFDLIFTGCGSHFPLSPDRITEYS
jgi:hypothetical protein